MTHTFKNAGVLVVGGAGFVGSNLVRLILREGPRKLTIIDNFLSADPVNVPDHPAVKLVSGPITSDRILHGLDDDLDYAYHLACFHGNQSSIHDPLMDHENNTLTTLKLFERLKDIKTLKKLVYSADVFAVAARTFGWRQRYSFEQTVRRMLAWFDVNGIAAIYSHMKVPERSSVKQSEPIHGS
jgi:UDP-glucose 4-epimerase